MTEKLRQSLSAVIDDEADAFELRRVLDELARDDELRSLWDRYHIIGNALRGEPSRSSSALRDRVWDALELAPDGVVELAAALPPGAAEQAQPAPGRSRLGRYTGLAVAASVAFAVVIGFQGFETGSSGTPALAGAAPASGNGPKPVVAAGAPDSLRPQVDLASEVSPSDVQRAHAYMLHHAQQQALNQAGVMSFVKLATYEAP